MAILLPVLLIGYLVFAALFIVVAWKAPKRAKWFGLASIAASAPIFFWLGAFAEQFGSGQCYSSAVGVIADAVEHTKAPAELAKRIRSLPLHGYETSCADVAEAARRLPNAGTP